MYKQQLFIHIISSKVCPNGRIEEVIEWVKNTKQAIEDIKYSMKQVEIILAISKVFICDLNDEDFCKEILDGMKIKT